MVLFTLEFPPHVGGVSRMHEGLAGAFGDDLTVVVPPCPEAEEFDKNFPAAIERRELLASSGWPRWRKSYRELKRIIGTHGSDVILGEVLPLGITAWLLSFTKSMRYSPLVHGLDVSSAMKVWRRRLLLRWIFRRAHRVFVANKHVAALVHSLGIEKDKIIVTYPAPQEVSIVPRDAARFRYQYGVNPSDPLLVTTCRLVERKGVDTVLRSLPALWEQFPGLRYVVIGDGPAKEMLQEQASKFEKSAQILFLGTQSDEVVSMAQAAADVFVMTPHTMSDGDVEGLGIVYLEASAKGTAVVGTDHGGVPEAIQNGKTGLLVPERNPEATAEAIADLLHDREKRLRFGQAGQQFVADTFSFEKSAGAMRDAYAI